LFCERNAHYCKMTAALLSLHYLPNIAWFKSYVHYDKIRIEKQENFVKATGRNRCEIAAANGRQTLTIPLDGGRDHHRKYTDTKIACTTNWQDSHWHSIKSSYGSAPYFGFYAHIFQKFYEKEYAYLFDFNLELLNATISVLKLKKEFEFTSEYQKTIVDATDLRTSRSVASEELNMPRYLQVFEERHGFLPNLSILDLIFNLGPQANQYLTKLV
jgi:hypothetical protein